jgi:hypothetical protein
LKEQTECKRWRNERVRETRHKSQSGPHLEAVCDWAIEPYSDSGLVDELLDGFSQVCEDRRISKYWREMRILGTPITMRPRGISVLGPGLEGEGPK